MTKFLYAGAALIAVAAGTYLYRLGVVPAPAADAPVEGTSMVAVTLPDGHTDQARLGKQAFDAVCATCHGKNAAGKQGFGPPLVHKIYESSHHGDMSFQLAVERGVRAHHWPFGDMPAQDGLTRADVVGIVAYVRELQHANGIN
jgi:mono/diheme cytochrome c family protein